MYRALECPASTVLPRIPDEEKAAATWGKEVHSWKQTGFPPTKRVADWLTFQAEDPWTLRERVWPGGEHEVMLKFDHNWNVSAEVYSTEQRFKEFKEGGLIRGVTDWVGPYGPLWRISDLKTGRFEPDDPPSQTPQLLLYGDIWLRLYPHDPGLYLSLDWLPRYPKGVPPKLIGPDYVSKEEVNDWHNTRLIPAYELSKKPKAKYDARPGPWCQYCKCQPWCPAQGGTPPNE